MLCQFQVYSPVPAPPTPCYFQGDTDMGGHTPLPGLQPGTSSGAPTQSSQARTGCHPLSRSLTPLPHQEPWSCSRKGPK